MSSGPGSPVQWRNYGGWGCTFPPADVCATLGSPHLRLQVTKCSSIDLEKVVHPLVPPLKNWTLVIPLLPFVSRTKPPEPPGCLFLEDLQTLHIPTNKKLEVWTQYRLLLSFLGGYFSSFRKILTQRKIRTKSGNQEKS